MVSIGITKRGLGFMPSKPSPLSTYSHGLTKEYGGDGAGWKKLMAKGQTEIRHEQEESREEGKNTGESGDTIRNYTGYVIDSDVEQNKVPREVLDILQAFPIFKQAPESFAMKVASQLRYKVYGPDEYVIRKGEPSESMYWILKGTVNIGDGESIHAELGLGSFFGEVGVIYNRPRTATVVTRSKVVVGIMGSESLNLVLQYYPSIERKIRDEAQGRLALQEKKYNTGLLKCNKTYHSKVEGYRDEHQTHPIPFLRILKDFTLFQQMPSYVVDELLSCAEFVKVPMLDYVFKKGDKDVDVYFIVRGRVEIIDNELDPKLGNKLTALESGNSIGISSFLSYMKGNKSIRRFASVMSVSPLELLKIRSVKLMSLCKQFSFIIDELEHESFNRAFLFSPRKTDTKPNSPPSTRLSIEFLMNENEDNLPEITNHSQSKKKKLQNQLPSYTTNSSGYENVSPISPISPLENIDSFSAQTQKITTAEAHINTKKRKLTADIHSLDFLDERHSAEPEREKFWDHDYRYDDNRMKLRSKNEVHSRHAAESLFTMIMLKVFEYLTIPELMKLRIVCKQWNEILSTAPGLCKKLDLTPWNTSIDDKSLISITNFVGARPQDIDISNCFHITDEGFSYMVNEIGISGKIKGLKMESNWEISGMAIMDLSVSIVGKHLENIDLANCRKVRDDVLERLTGWDSRERNQTNKELEEGNKISDVSVGCKNLKAINVGYCKHLTDNIMYHISQNANERLESLDLTRCTTITDKGFEYWNRRHFPNLRKLSLKDCTFLTDKAIISIANSANNLEVLDLKFCCALSDVSIDMLCLGCPKLKHLDLSFCGSAVSDFSLANISLHLRFLEKLILKGCIRVTRAGIDSLLSSCSMLNYLNVSQCKNAHVYPGGVQAQMLKIHSQTKTAFVTAGSYKNIVEIAV
ncbi:unnamed protein product [Debaryomyces fabryi]|nr:unnamed protein product [Debaryomyces fabryi]